MTDRISPERRSENMRRIRGSDTRPELLVRCALHAMGYRFRLHRKDLPGTPDIVLPRYKLAVFVHGCFWHRHEGCSNCTTPKTRPDFWNQKFASNVERDARAASALQNAGWRPAVIWECETVSKEKMDAAIARAVRNPAVCLCDNASVELQGKGADLREYQARPLLKRQTHHRSRAD